MICYLIRNPLKEPPKILYQYCLYDMIYMKRFMEMDEEEVREFFYGGLTRVNVLNSDI